MFFGYLEAGWTDVIVLILRMSSVILVTTLIVMCQLWSAVTIL